MFSLRTVSPVTASRLPDSCALTRSSNVAGETPLTAPMSTVSNVPLVFSNVGATEGSNPTIVAPAKPRWLPCPIKPTIVNGRLPDSKTTVI